MAQAATRHAIEPRTISFKGTAQTLEAFQESIALLGQRVSTISMRNCLIALQVIVWQTGPIVTNLEKESGAKPFNQLYAPATATSAGNPIHVIMPERFRGDFKSHRIETRK